MIANLSASTGDGLHYSMDVAEEQADLVLNAVCSGRLAGLPDTTCGLDPVVASGGRSDEALWTVCAVAVVLLSAALLRRGTGASVFLSLARVSFSDPRT